MKLLTNLTRACLTMVIYGDYKMERKYDETIAVASEWRRLCGFVSESQMRMLPTTYPPTRRCKEKFTFTVHDDVTSASKKTLLTTVNIVDWGRLNFANAFEVYWVSGFFCWLFCWFFFATDGEMSWWISAHQQDVSVWISNRFKKKKKGRNWFC